MKKMTGGQAAVEAIRAEGTSHVFGLIGSATMEMFDERCEGEGGLHWRTFLYFPELL